MKRAGIVAILVLAFCGLADSAYIAQTEAVNAPLICDVTDLSGCNIVATSPYAYLFGISIATYGVFFYGVIFILAALELVLPNRIVRRILQGVALIGVTASLYFSYLEFFVIKALCIFCIASAIIAFFILFFASFIEPIKKKQSIV